MADQKLRQLASVKHQIYHPQLPTLRRMDMDTAVHRLSTEHSRHTTFCPKNQFTIIRTTLHPRKEILHCRNIAENDTKNKLMQYKELNDKQFTDEWNKTLKQLNTLSSKPVIKEDPVVSPPHNTGLYFRRKLHPDISSSWMNALEVKYHKTRPTSARPLPAMIYNRYRNTSRPYSAYPWY